MGDFPIMTGRGTFIINGTERVVVSQLVRSPGAYFSKDLDKTSDKDVYVAKIIPGRGAWLEFDVDKKDTVGVRIDRKRRQNVTVLLKALGWTRRRDPDAVRQRALHPAHAGEGPRRDAGGGARGHLPQAPPGRAADGGVRAHAPREPVLQPEALRPGPGRPPQGRQEARRRRRRPAEAAARSTRRRWPSSTTRTRRRGSRSATASSPSCRRTRSERARRSTRPSSPTRTS